MGKLRTAGRTAALWPFGVLVVGATLAGVAPARALPLAEAPLYAIDDYPFQKAPALKQWRSVLDREAHLTATADPDDCKDGMPRLACAAKEAALLEEKLDDKTPTDQVAGVYAYFNAVKYKEHDPENCGVDCWKSRLQLLAQREGDCGDHALAEYFTLKRLGFKERDLQLIVAQLPGFEDSFKGGHVVLRVRAEGEYYILDNRSSELADLSDLRKYKVLAGLNAESVQIYNLVTDVPPPGFIADAVQQAALVASPKIEETPVLVADASSAKDAAPQPTLATAAVPAPSSKPAESDADDASSDICMQSARLAEWNPLLPCTPVASVKMVVKAKTIIGETPPAATKTAKPAEAPIPASAPPKIITALTALSATAPAPSSAGAEAAADDGEPVCIQGARLADWNPDLPCSSGGASQVRIQMTDATPEM